MIRRKALLLTTALVLLTGACDGGGSGVDAGGDDARGAPPDAAAAALPEEAFEMSDGREVGFGEFVGEPLVVNFFASWCPPCRAEMPDFEAVHQAVGDRVRILGFDVQDTDAAARKLVEQTGITYSWAFDRDGSIYRAFEGFAMPTTLYISADGEVVGRDNGPIDASRLADRIEEHFGVDVPPVEA